MKNRNRFLSLVLAVCMVLTLVPANAFAAQTPSPASGTVSLERLQSPALDRNAALAQNAPQSAGKVTGTKIEKPAGLGELTLSGQVQSVEDTLIPADEKVRVIVVLEEKGLLEQGFSTREIGTGSRAKAASRILERQQNAVMAQISTVSADAELRYHYTIAANGFALEIPYGDLAKLDAIRGIREVFVAPRYDVPQDQSDSAIDPLVYASSSDVGAVETWEAGYDGNGMIIAVIDTGLDLDHPSFAAAPEEPALTLEDVQRLAGSLNAPNMYSGATAERLYRSEKIPFAFNYVDRNLDVTHDNDDQGDHGTHVSGIAAANRLDSTPVVGVAPDAQLLVMKVFGASGGAFFDDILAALEDSIVLGAHAVNVSLGTPAGFSSTSPVIDEIFSRILDSDMIASIAAGNSTSAALMNGWGTHLNLTSDPDNSIISSPSAYIGATSVASSENASIRYPYVELENGTQIPYNDVAATSLNTLYQVAQKAEYVMIPGYGDAADFEGIAPTMTEDGSRAYGVSIAVIQRGVIDFVSKQFFAASAGFDACLVYDNVDGDLINMADGAYIPNAFISKASGEAMAAAADENGRGVLYLKDIDDTATLPNAFADQMSSFSSWGLSPDLDLTPEITAPGGYIYSTINNGHYGTMSGTSMAAPQISGMSALLLQYLQEQYPHLTDAQLHTVTESLLMSTATPVMEYEGIPYSPRKQGAGLANIRDAIASPVYMTVQGRELTPKVNLGDDDTRQGVYPFSFTMHNLTGTAQSYRLEGIAMTDQFVEIDGLEFMGETSRKLDAQVRFTLGALDAALDYNADGAVDLGDVQDFLDAVNGLSQVKAGFDLNGDGVTDTADVQKLYEQLADAAAEIKTVEVPANGSVTVSSTVTLTAEDKAYMDEHYCNGIYVDGFIRAYAEDGEAVDLSLPFAGFYGDWSAAPMFDSGWYYDPDAVANRYMNVLFTDYGSSSYNLGLNPYLVEPYDPAHNVLSPNGDNFLDSVNDIYLGLMRNARDVTYAWKDAQGGLLFETGVSYQLKSYYIPQYGFPLPLVYSWNCEPYYFRDEKGYVVEDLDRVTLEINGWLDDGDDTADDTIVTNVVIDTEAPVLDLESLDYFYSEKTDSRMLKLTVSDNYDIAAVIPLTRGGSAFEYIPVTTKIPGVDGESDTILLDVSDYDGSFQIAVCDYGCNESYYQITFEGEQNYAEDSFYAYRLLAQVDGGDGNIYLTEAYNGWHSFSSADKMLMHTSMFDENETYTYAAEYIDGYIVAVDANSTIYAVELGTWERTDFGKLSAEIMVEFYPGGYEVGDYYMMEAEFPALDMAFDYTTDTLFVLTDESMYLGPNTGGHLLALDWLTGKAAYIGRVSGLTEDHQALTLACDNEGILYTVDAVTGDLYTIDKTTAAAAFVGATGYTPLYQQSMAVDHDTNKLYWAAYQDFTGTSVFLELDKATGSVLSTVPTEYNSQLAGLLKPYDCGRDLIPEGTLPESLRLKETRLTLRGGDTAALHVQALPYYAQMNAADIRWTSSDETVAAVSGGVVTAVGSGSAVITAQYGELSASCRVDVIALEGELFVYDYGTDMSASMTWLAVDVNAPQGAAPVANVLEIPAGVTAAAYADGYVYAFDSTGAFYRLDAATMTGEQLRPADNTTMVTAMAFNYADGFMYALSFDGGVSFTLNQVNLRTGELRSVITSLDMYYGTPLGGMAIDQEGRFYLMNVDSADNVKLDSFTLFYDGWMYNPMDYAGATLNSLSCYSFSSLVWSEANNGLFWANDQGTLHWIGAEVITRQVDDGFGGTYDEIVLETAPVLLGSLGSTVSAATGMAMNMGLLEIVENAPALPEVALTSASLPAEITVPVNGSVQAELSVEPWNAGYTVEYTTADESVATVSDRGLLQGTGVGETTLTVTVYDASGAVFQTLTATVTAVDSDVDVYMFMVTDGGNGGDAWLRVDGADPRSLSVASNYAFTVYAGAYYDGKVYAVAPGGEEYGYKNHLMRIDAETFLTEEILPYELPFDIRDMAFHYTTGTMYGIAQGGEVLGGICQLDLTTGEATVVADSGRELATLSCDAAGQLYTITADGWLSKLDKQTAQLTEISQVAGSLTGYQSMHYDHNTGNTFWGSSSLSLVDTAKGTVTNLGRIGGMYMAVDALFTIPEQEPAVPETTEVSGVSLPERAAAVAGQTVQLSATVLPVSVSSVDKTVTWSSSDESVATVDENGLVTALSGGTVTITASAGSYSDSCTVTVLAEPQRFYAYDETTTRWVQIDTASGALTTVMDETGLAPIMAAAEVDGVIYAFDDDGYFYAIDPETFVRTKLSEGIHGRQQECFDGYSYYPVDVDITDLSYDAESGRLIGLMNGVYEDYDVGLYLVYSAIVEINLQAGRMNPYTWEEMQVGELIFIQTYDGSNGIYRPGNLLMKGGYAYSVDTWYSGILSRVSMTWDPWSECFWAGATEQLAHVNQLEWGMYYDSRSLVYDPLFDTVYTIHDLGMDDFGNPRGDVTLCTINLGNASTREVCTLGRGIVLNSLIIR